MQDKKDNSGALFNNADNPNAKTPYGGSAVVGGVEYWLNGWVKEMKDGKKYFSLSFKQKETQQIKPEPRQQSWSEELSDDIPF